MKMIITERQLSKAQLTTLTLCQLQQLAHVTSPIVVLKRGNFR
jgi:hypothetical protein